MTGDPIFEPGDRVVDFRGKVSTVVTMTRIGDPHRSNKVHIQEEGGGQGEYYSTCFRFWASPKEGFNE